MSGPLRVLQIANQAGPLRLFVLPVCRAMRDAGADVELACMRMGPNYPPLAEAGFVLHGLPAGPWSSPVHVWRLYRRIRKLLREKRYDLMVVHTPVMSWLARRAARGCVGATAYLAHGLPYIPGRGGVRNWLLGRIDRSWARYTDAIIVMNEVDAKTCRQRRLTRTEGMWFKVSGVGLDVDAWSAPPEPARLAELDVEFGLAPDRPLVIYLGRFIPAKRPGDVIELARRTGPAADYILAGEGPLWEPIRREAETLGPHVHVLRFTDRIHELIHRCDVAAFPSVFLEGLPRFLLEVQMAGKPPVAYDVRGSHDAIADGRTGLLVPPGDTEAFCAAAGRLIDDAALRRRLGEAGPAHVIGRFSLAASVRYQLGALATVLQAKGLDAPWASTCPLVEPGTPRDSSKARGSSSEPTSLK